MPMDILPSSVFISEEDDLPPRARNLLPPLMKAKCVNTAYVYLKMMWDKEGGCGFET